MTSGPAQYCVTARSMQALMSCSSIYPCYELFTDSRGILYQIQHAKLTEMIYRVRSFRVHLIYKVWLS
jgi:hypothetical protein